MNLKCFSLKSPEYLLELFIIKLFSLEEAKTGRVGSCVYSN